MKEHPLKIYKADRKGYINFLIIGAVLLPLVVFLWDADNFIENPLMLLPLIAPLLMFVWIYFDTVYKLKQDLFIYHSGFLKGKIDVSKITEIIINKTLWSGIKPALAKDGMIIKFNTYDEIYIAPEDKNTLISDLLSINPKICVVDANKIRTL